MDIRWIILSLQLSCFTLASYVYAIFSTCSIIFIIWSTSEPDPLDFRLANTMAFSRLMFGRISEISSHVASMADNSWNFFKKLFKIYLKHVALWLNNLTKKIWDKQTMFVVVVNKFEFIWSWSWLKIIQIFIDSDLIWNSDI